MFKKQGSKMAFVSTKLKMAFAFIWSNQNPYSTSAPKPRLSAKELHCCDLATD